MNRVITRDSAGLSRIIPRHKILKLIIPAKSLLLFKAKSSQAVGIRTWTSLWGHYTEMVRAECLRKLEKVGFRVAVGQIMRISMGQGW